MERACTSHSIEARAAADNPSVCRHARLRRGAADVSALHRRKRVPVPGVPHARALAPMHTLPVLGPRPRLAAPRSAGTRQRLRCECRRRAGSGGRPPGHRGLRPRGSGPSRRRARRHAVSRGTRGFAAARRVVSALRGGAAVARRARRGHAGRGRGPRAGTCAQPAHSPSTRDPESRRAGTKQNGTARAGGVGSRRARAWSPGGHVYAARP